MLRPDPEFAQNRVEGIGDLVALDKDPVGIEHGCFLPRVPVWAQKPTQGATTPPKTIRPRITKASASAVIFMPKAAGQLLCKKYTHGPTG